MHVRAPRLPPGASSQSDQSTPPCHRHRTFKPTYPTTYLSTRDHLPPQTPPFLQALSPEDLAKLQIDDKKGGAAAGREKTRLTKSTGQSIKDGAGRIGGPFTVSENPAFLAERLQTYQALAVKRQAELDGA